MDEPDPLLKVEPGAPAGPGGSWVAKIIFDNDAVVYHVGDKAQQILELDNTDSPASAGPVHAEIFLHSHGAHLTNHSLSGPGVTHQTVTIEPGGRVMLPINLDTSHAGTLTDQSIYVKNLDGPGSILVPITGTVYNYARPSFTQTAGPPGKLTHTAGTNDWTLDLGVRPAGGWLSQPLSIFYTNAAKGPTDSLTLDSLLPGTLDHPPPAGAVDLVNVNGHVFDIHQQGEVLKTTAGAGGRIDSFQSPTQYLTIVDHAA